MMGSGDETVMYGRMQTLDLTETDSDLGPLRAIIAGGHSYLQVPTSISHASKPWILAASDSRHPEVRQLATTMLTMERDAAINQFANFSDGATVRTHDRENLAIGPTTHYSLSVDVHKLWKEDQQWLVNAGVTSFPMDVWLDRKNRLVKFTQTIPVHEGKISVVMTVGNFDAPVTVTPPRADQVFTD
jgi:hypothetical protein